MALPRILSIGADGFLRQQPAPEFEKLRGAQVTARALPLKVAPTVLRGVRGDCMELDVQLSMGNASAVRLDLRCSDAGKPGASITINNEGLLSVGNSTTLLGKNERHRLRIFLDKRVFEVYADDGMAALYSTVDAGPNDLNIATSAKGDGAALPEVHAWPLKSAQFDLTRFKA